MQTTLWWNTTNTLPMHGVITHVSDPYSITNWTTAKYIWPEVQASAPSLHITPVGHAQFRLSFRRLITTAGQFLSSALIISPRYLKQVTWVRGIPSAVNAFSAPALASSCSRQRYFLSAPRQKNSVVMCQLLRDLCDTNMSHWGQLG